MSGKLDRQLQAAIQTIQKPVEIPVQKTGVVSLKIETPIVNEADKIDEAFFDDIIKNQVL